MPAIPLLEAAYQRDSSDIEVNLLLGSALGKTYDRQEAFRLLDHAEVLMRPKPAIVNQLTLFRAETWACEGRTEEAARLYYALWKAYPDRIGILHALIRKNGRSPAKIPLYSVYNPSISLGLQREDRQIDKNSK